MILIVENCKKKKKKKKESRLIVSVGKCALRSKIQSVHIGEMPVLLIEKNFSDRLSVIIQSVFNPFCTGMKTFINLVNDCIGSCER